MNKLIAGYGAAAISVYGGYSKFSSFGTLPIFGVTRGMTPILGYCTGAKDGKRFIETRNLAMKYASVFAVLTSILFVAAPGAVLYLISATPEMKTMGMQAYRLLGFPIALYGVSIVLAQEFPPAKKSYITTALTLARQVGYMVPLCILFSKKWGITGIWSGYAAADIINFFVVIIVAGWFRRKVVEKWKTTPTE